MHRFATWGSNTQIVFGMPCWSGDGDPLNICGDHVGVVELSFPAWKESHSNWFISYPNKYTLKNEKIVDLK